MGSVDRRGVRCDQRRGSSAVVEVQLNYTHAVTHIRRGHESAMNSTS